MNILALLPLTVILPALATAAETGATFVQPQLLADVSSIAPGEQFTIGVLYKIRPGWHIYWKNNGDSGSPTALKFSAPAGFTISELRWPAPRRFVEEGPIIDYGYTDSVVLSARVTPPKALKPGQNVTITASTQWLVCSDRCLPGEASLKLDLPVSDRAPADNHELFAATERQLPISIDSDQSPLRAEFSGQIPLESRAADFKVTLKWLGAPGKDVEFCPDPGPVLNIDEIHVSPTQIAGSGKVNQTGTIISFKAAVLKGKSLDRPLLPAVVVFTDSNGVRRGVALDVPLRPISP